MNLLHLLLTSGVRPVIAAVAGAAAEYTADRLLGLSAWLARHKKRSILLVLALACSFLAAQAAPAPSAPSAPSLTQYDFTPESTISLISNTVNSTLTAVEGNAKLKGYGDAFSAFFLVALLVWTGLKTMAAGRGIGELIGEWVPIFVSFGVVYLLLNKDAGSQIVRLMDGVATAVSGLDMSTLDGAIKTGVMPIFKGIAAVSNQPRISEGANVSGIGDALGFLSTIGSGLASMVIGAITKVVAIIVLVLVAVVMLAHIIMGYVSVRLVLALAPVMVPFLMFRPLGWIFEGWLRFLLGACMLKVVIAFLVVMVGGLLSGMTTLAMQIYNESYRASNTETMYVDVLLYGMMMVFAILSGLLVHQAPSIANGLIPGGNATGFNGIRALTQSAGGRITSSAMSGVGSAVGQVAGRAGSWAKGAVNGAKGQQKDGWFRAPANAAAYARGYNRFAPPKTPAAPPTPPAP